jgi:hypothetical protein
MVVVRLCNHFTATRAYCNIKHLRFTHQADGGANFAATDRQNLLHSYNKMHHTPIAIVAFFSQDTDTNTTPQEHTVTGEGILKLIGDHGEITPMRMLYTPNSTGTVISPERTIKDMQRFNKNSRIVSWSQNGGQQRSLQWKDKEGRTMSSLQMEERNGLCCIKNATLLPPAVKPSVKAMHTIEPIQEVSNDDGSETPNHPEPTVDATVTAPIHVETIPDTESETASTQANQNTDE